MVADSTNEQPDGELTCIRADAVKSVAGRSCPLRYRYDPSVFNCKPKYAADTLYVIGGLYGNVEALCAILDMKEEEMRRGYSVKLVFNGDFNWFDVDDVEFRQINEAVLAHCAIKGNVEEELDAADDDSSGCGCGYPSYVDDSIVTRSNEIIARLQQTAKRLPDLMRHINALSLYETVSVGGERIAVVHGDPESLAGWKFAVELMDPADQPLREKLGCVNEGLTTRDQVIRFFRRACARVFACSHTGLPFAQDFRVDSTRCLVINNGSAGMQNFKDTTFGVLTRISIDPRPPSQSLYGINIGPLRCDALPIFFDHSAWLKRFLRTWPEGSPAHASYFERIVKGPEYILQQAVRGNLQAAHRG